MPAPGSEVILSTPPTVAARSRIDASPSPPDAPAAASAGSNPVPSSETSSTNRRELRVSRTKISVSLTRNPRRVVLEVSDNGTGFDPKLAPGGLGLASMRERAGAVGGVLRITSAPGAGTTVRLTVPS